MKNNCESESTFSKAKWRQALNEGSSHRKRVPRSAHGDWSPPKQRPDPVAVLQATSVNRLEHLLPLRYSRMSISPFTYMRGSAAMMAYDLSSTPSSDLHVQLCGDCHLANFGAFASPERRILFDITDFDETFPGPWEYDVKRLATSFVLLCRENEYPKSTTREVVLQMLQAYRTHMREFALKAPLDIWNYIIDSELLIKTAPDKATRLRRIEFEKHVRTRTSEKRMNKLMHKEGDGFRLIEQPPLIARLKPKSELEASFMRALEKYPESLADDRRHLLSLYSLHDLAFKVVGVGSVGTRCGVALYLSPIGHRILLQVKEAYPSVLEKFADKNPYKHDGKRVVSGQRKMQCASDIFLGWGDDNKGRHYYVRQLHDMKTNLSMETLVGPVLFNFANMCGWALARAHAKSGDPVRISGYIGESDQIDKAITRFAFSYSDQCEEDYEVFMDAVRQKKLPVEPASNAKTDVKKKAR